MNTLNYSAKLPLYTDVDIVVAGGGVAGTCAAIASARSGAKVLIIEQNGCLGGSATVGLVTPISAVESEKGKISFGGIIREIYDELRRDEIRFCKTDKEGLGSSAHVLKYILIKKLHESGAEALFHANVADVINDGDKISALVVSTRSGLVYVKAKVFIDCTGDGEVMKNTNADCILGSEPNVLSSLIGTGLDKSATDGKAIPMDDYTGEMQPCSIMFNMGNVNTAVAGKFVNKPVKFSDLGMTKDDFEKWEYCGTSGFEPRSDEFVPLPQGRILFFDMGRDGEVVVNMSRIVNVNGADAKELSNAAVLSHLQVIAIVDFLQRFVPGFENSYLIESGFSLGVRETRRLIGEYVLSGKEVVNCTPLSDVVAHGSYIIDIHDPKGKRMAIGGSLKGDFYDIPFGSLYTREVKNMLVAGRIISADHVAHSSTRIQGTCMLTGEAVGTAAAIAVKENIFPVNVKTSALQEKLINNGVKLMLRS